MAIDDHRQLRSFQIPATIDLTQRHQHDPTTDQRRAKKKTQVLVFPVKSRRQNGDNNHAQSLKRVEVTKVEVLEQP